jgi:hypothetical protein
MKTLRNIFLSLLATGIAGIPTLLYLTANTLLAPEGFWQNLLLAGVGLWFLGGIQLLLIALWVLALVAIWFG